MKVDWVSKDKPGFINAWWLGGPFEWQIIDLDTGKDIGPNVAWADDESGLYETILDGTDGRYYLILLDPKGNYHPPPPGIKDGQLPVGWKLQVARAIRQGRLKIIPPPGKEEDAAELMDRFGKEMPWSVRADEPVVAEV